MPPAPLPDVLRAAAVDVINERGLGGFSLREVTRRAGVSHAAPTYHFQNAAGLLTAVAIEGFTILNRYMDEAGEGITDPIERMIALGCAYVRAGRDHPAHFQVAFRSDLLDNDNPQLQTVGFGAYATLEDAVRAVAAAENPDLDVTAAADLAWSAMQGLLVLYPNIAEIGQINGRAVDDIDTMAKQFCELLIDGLRGRR